MVYKENICVKLLFHQSRDYIIGREDYYHTISEMTGKSVSTVRNVT